MKYGFLILTLFTTAAIAQKTKKVTVKSDYPSFKETYFVLKSDEQVKHGKYKLEISKTLLKKGQFQNNEKVGIWEYYNPEGDVIHKFDVDNSQIIYEAEPNQNFDKIKFSRPAMVLGGYQSLYQQIASIMRYPAEARRMGAEGRVMVKLTIAKDGSFKNIEAVEGVGYGLDEEAVKVFRMMNLDILPALNPEGEPIETEIILPVTFKLG